jgi:hypothetical protein
VSWEAFGGDGGTDGLKLAADMLDVAPWQGAR